MAAVVQQDLHVGTYSWCNSVTKDEVSVQTDEGRGGPFL